MALKQCFLVWQPPENTARKQMFPKTCFAVIESIALEKCVFLPDEIVEGTCDLINCKDYWKPLEYEVIRLTCVGVITMSRSLL